MTVEPTRAPGPHPHVHADGAAREHRRNRVEQLTAQGMAARRVGLELGVPTSTVVADRRARVIAARRTAAAGPVMMGPEPAPSGTAGFPATPTQAHPAPAPAPARHPLALSPGTLQGTSIYAVSLSEPAPDRSELDRALCSIPSFTTHRYGDSPTSLMDR